MSNFEFFLAYGTAPLGFLIAGILAYIIARRGRRDRSGGHAGRIAYGP